MKVPDKDLILTEGKQLWSLNRKQLRYAQI